MRAHFFIVTILLIAVSILRAQQATTSQSSPPLSVSDVEHGLKAGVTNARMAALVKQYGVDFDVTDAVKKEFSEAGANSDLLLMIAKNKRSIEESGISSSNSASQSSSLQPGSRSCDRSWSSKWDHIVNSDFRDRLLKNVGQFSSGCSQILKLTPQQVELELQYMPNSIGAYGLQTFYSWDAALYFQGWVEVCKCRQRAMEASQ
jgi:hypothetical protein